MVFRPGASGTSLASARSVVMALAAVLLAAGSLPASLQDETTDETESRYFYRTPDGQWIPLTELGVSEEELERRIQQGQAPRVPRHEITEIALSGHVEREVAYLTAKIRVDLSVDDEWVVVPVGMDEAHLSGAAEYEGAGRAMYDSAGSRQTRVRRWFLFGKGQHEIRLPLVVPIRTQQHILNLLRLTIPPAAATHLKLTVPQANIVVDVPAGSGSRTEPAGAGTLIDVWGLRDQFVLQWEERPDARGATPLLRSQTGLSVNLSTDPFAVRAQQTLLVRQGTIETFTVLVPPGLALADTDVERIDPTGRVESVTVNTARTPTRVRVTLREPLSERLELDWNLTTQNEQLARRWDFQGWLVEEAREQTTDLDLSVPEGFVIRELQAEGLQRRRTARPSGIEASTSNCRFLGADSRFAIELQEVDPFYTVSPRMLLYMAEDQMRLDARFRVSMLRGSVQQLVLHWPDRLAQDWRVLPLTAADLTVWQLPELASDEPDRLVLQLLSRSGGDFEIGLSAVRPVQQGVEMPLSLPRVMAATRQPAPLILSHEANVEVQLEAVDDTMAVPIPVDARMLATFQTAPQQTGAATTARLIRSDQRRFNASITPRDRAIQTSTSVVLAVEDDGIDVEQSISYRVDFDHLDALRMTVPDGVDPEVSLAEGEALRRTSGATVSRFVLPEPLVGDFTVVARYRVPLIPGEVPGDIAVPLLQSSDSAFVKTRIGLEHGARYRATPAGDWVPAFAGPLEAAWVQDGWREQVTLSLEPVLRGTARRFRVRRALIQTFASGSMAESRATFVVDGTFSELPLSVPAGVSVTAIGWNGQPLRGDEWTVVERQDESVLRIDIKQSAGSGVLSVDFRSRLPSSSWGRAIRLESPTMPADVVVGETAWDVVFPTAEHLAAWTRDMVPGFRWQLSLTGWKRQPIPAYSDLDTWLLGRENKDIVAVTGGNTYVFTQTGAAGSLRIWSIDQSLILLFGAGIAFLTGVICLNFSARRMALLIPSVGLLVGVLALWYLPTIQLLFQPALLGIALAVLAQAMDRRRRRRGYGLAGVTRPLVRRPSALSTPSSVHAAGTDDPTLIRNQGALASSQDLVQ